MCSSVFSLSIFSKAEYAKRCTSPWSTNVFTDNVTRYVSLISHLRKPGPAYFSDSGSEAYRHKKPISFLLNSRSSIIWPHFPPCLSIAVLGSPFFGRATRSPACCLCQWPWLILPGPSFLFFSTDSVGASPPYRLPCRPARPAAAGLPVQWLPLETWLWLCLGL